MLIQSVGDLDYGFAPSYRIQRFLNDGPTTPIVTNITIVMNDPTDVETTIFFDQNIRLDQFTILAYTMQLGGGWWNSFSFGTAGCL